MWVRKWFWPRFWGHLLSGLGNPAQHFGGRNWQGISKSTWNQRALSNSDTNTCCVGFLLGSLSKIYPATAGEYFPLIITHSLSSWTFNTFWEDNVGGQQPFQPSFGQSLRSEVTSPRKELPSACSCKNWGLLA